MGFFEFSGDGIVGLGFVLTFCALIIIFALFKRLRPAQFLREIHAFAKLGDAIGKSVEAGKRLHLTIGWGKVSGQQGASGLVGISVLDRTSRTASISDRPPITTSGDGILAIMSQDMQHRTLRSIGAEGLYDPDSGRVSGLTSFSYAAGTIPVIFDEQVASTIMIGHFGSEVALIADASERSESFTLGGSDNIPGQAVLFATVEEPLLGEEVFAAGAYLRAGPVHTASLHTQDVFRWVLSVVILIGAILKLLGSI